MKKLFIIAFALCGLAKPAYSISTYDSYMQKAELLSEETIKFSRPGYSKYVCGNYIVEKSDKIVKLNGNIITSEQWEYSFDKLVSKRIIINDYPVSVEMKQHTIHGNKILFWGVHPYYINYKKCFNAYEIHQKNIKVFLDNLPSTIPQTVAGQIYFMVMDGTEKQLALEKAKYIIAAKQHQQKIRLNEK
ncbi:hypothetical protein AVV66_gp039 [Escherichia phage vB_EcoM_VR26]|uniref:Uncharacterized protein n=1 Tax=Escherichia phage vB_EcoM_VR26 TaxID=1567029 RepID=A0A0A7HEB5_9CAUD|nr:hypothetical protein AVV66_gp039 [Escherichia phage vB_EcoM_VR26]AIZ02676.1 hypothetical protein VR26_039 [Escherichia phage vB_EcoM_VR26]